jgi:hypothetical protein
MRSSMAPAAAAACIRGGLTQGVWPRLTRPGAQVRGRAYVDDVRLWAVRRGWRNSWRPVVRGRFDPAPDGGSVLIGSIGWHPAARVFTYFWLGGVAAFEVTAIVLLTGAVLRGEWRALLPGLPFLIAPLAMGAFGAGLVLVASQMGAGDEKYLRTWLRQRLGSTE